VVVQNGRPLRVLQLYSPRAPSLMVDGGPVDEYGYDGLRFRSVNHIPRIVDAWVD